MISYLNMVNAWSLAASVLDGTLDEDYPIMTKAETTITPQESDEYDPPKAKPEPVTSLETEDTDKVVNVPLGNVNLDQDITIKTDIEHSKYWYDYNRNDPDRENPFTDSFDYMMAETVVGNGNTASYEYGYPSAFTTLSDNDDSIAHHITTPGIQKDCNRKYKEDESIKALQDYISTTYGGHYTSDNNNVQTLDLIESVGDAESFCRSNAIKYLSRYDKKGQAKRDILKALHYTLLLYHFSGQLNETPTRGYETF